VQPVNKARTGVIQTDKQRATCKMKKFTFWFLLFGAFSVTTASSDRTDVTDGKQQMNHFIFLQIL
jgi:hypothetical protein